MCRVCKQMRLAAVALSLAAVVPAVASAQGKTSLQARQERILRLQVEHALVLRAQLKAYEDSLRRDRTKLDSMQVGPLRLLVDAPLRARTEVSARLAAARIDSLAGSAVAKLAFNRIVVKVLREHQDSAEVSLTGHADFQGGLISDTSLARWIGDRAITLLYYSLDAPFRDWLKMQAVLSPDTVRTETWARLRMAMVSSPSFVAHKCFDGDIAACSVGLGLTPVTEKNKPTQWFDAAGRRRLVARAVTLTGHVRRPEAAVRCDNGDDSGCLEFLDGQMWWVTDPIDPVGRFALTQLAIEMGGKRGYERLLNSTGTPHARLAAAAGVPLDSVLRAWQSRVRNTRMQTDNMSPALGAASLAWILVCAGLSLRSSRWR